MKEDGSARRKRNRETQDIEAPLICDVCMKEKGQGGIVAKDSKASIDFSVEVSSTTRRTSFLSNFADVLFLALHSSSVSAVIPSTSDARIVVVEEEGESGESLLIPDPSFVSTLADFEPPSFSCRSRIGKWRCKELFLQGRKTCSLAHTRIGAAPLELGVWEISELNSLGVTDEVVRHCERMWMDRTLARMAVPDVLEVESINREGVVSLVFVPFTRRRTSS